MNFLNRKIALKLTMIGVFLLLACQNENQYLDLIKLNSIVSDDLKNTSTKINYQGILINHRFETTVQDLEKVHTKNYLKEVYNKFRSEHYHTAASRSESEHIALPGPNALLEASKVVLVDFPYEKIENFNSLLLPEENYFNLDMVAADFDNFTVQDIHSNHLIIDQYYSQNLDYLVLKEIAQNPAIYDHLDAELQRVSRSEWSTYWCTMELSLRNGYGLVRASIAYTLAGVRARTSSSNYYADLNASDSRRDAYRHVLWNSLLANYYFTIVSKTMRLGFAELVTNARETTCGGPNEADAREMDYHNNFIGRDLWDQNTTYRTLLGIRVGLRKPSTSDLKEIARYRVDKRSCFIVKEHPDDVVFNYTVVETRHEILNMNATTIVYIRERIAPKLQRTQVSYDFSDCGGGSDSGFNEFVDINHIDGNTIDLDDPCVRRIYTTTFVSACFISKDANYNPY